MLARNSAVRVDREQLEGQLGRRLTRQMNAQFREQSLSPAEAVNHGRLLATQAQLVRQQGDGEPAKIADVLADRQGAVDVMAGIVRGSNLLYWAISLSART